MSLALLRAAQTDDQLGGYVPGAMPAPVQGWNARDSLDGMAPGFAVRLDNFFPFNGFVGLRGGARVWASGLGGPVETLAYWADATTEKVIAGANGQLWDINFGSATSLASGFTNNQWQWAQSKGTRTSSTAAVALLYLLNGVDTAQTYDGTTVTAATWTAASGQPTLDLTKLQNAAILQDILFIAERGEMGFWHSAKGSVGPGVTLSWFDLGTVLPNGGEIVDIAGYTVEGGIGPEDYTCFVASTGWVAVYRGTDPADASTWAIVGRYPLGFALGRRCTLEMAGDVIVMTVNGYISMRQFIQVGGLLRQSFVFNDNIQPEVVRQTGDYKFFFGWEPVLVPGQTLALFNVPQGGLRFDQHVVNTQTGAWSRLTNWNGVSWLATTEDLFYGTLNGEVVQTGFGTTDIDQNFVEGTGTTAFTYAGRRGQRKMWQMYRPILEIAGDVQVDMALATDFDLTTFIPGGAAVTAETPAVWNVSEWNVGLWGGGRRTDTNWLTAGQLGYSAAFRLNVRSGGSVCNWKGVDFSYTPGGLL